jgi:hypothetical protein
MVLTADKKGRLSSREWFEPGADYKPEHDAQGNVVLKKLAPVTRPRKTRAEVLAAIRSSSLRFGRTWEELREETREP